MAIYNGGLSDSFVGSEIFLKCLDLFDEVLNRLHICHNHIISIIEGLWQPDSIGSSIIKSCAQRMLFGQLMACPIHNPDLLVTR